MEELFRSGRIIDLSLAFITLEGLLLLFLRGRTGRGLQPADLLGNLLAGAFLMLAVRNVVTGGPWVFTALFLTASLPAHLYDLVRRSRLTVNPTPGGRFG
ncbi:MAG: hypothetical protein IPG45_31790 [Deltaproteobacteria bacterium]|jgi:hypothetical protein|nr:hypothetical protein [Deltaproteobacteria bacterium]